MLYKVRSNPINPHYDELHMTNVSVNHVTVTLRKVVTKYKNMCKWMVECLRKSESRHDKIALVTQFASPNLSIYFHFVRCAVC